MTDFRRADPTYIGFVPKTADEAIDLFYRMKRLGLSMEHYPEAFVHCSRGLDATEGGRFEEWLVAPQGVSTSALLEYKVDPEAERIRLQLLKEAEARDAADELARLRISEHSAQLDTDDEKAPMSTDDCTTDQDVDVEMATPSDC